MKEKILSLVLALVLCLGLAVPAMAVDTSGLDANAQKAYSDILNGQIKQYGIVSQSFGPGVEFAALEDMDADGIPELIIIRYEAPRGDIAVINIWTMRNGSAVQTASEEIYPAGEYNEAYIFLARKPGQVAVCNSFEWFRTGYWGVSLEDYGDEEWTDDKPLAIDLYYADGSADRIAASRVTDMAATWAAFEAEWTGDDIRLLGGGGLWFHDEKAAETITQVQDALSAGVNDFTGFTDVKSDAYYADAVQWAVDKEITAGTSANKFSPEQTCTVAQILTFLWRANGSPKQTGGNPFSDVSSGDYYYDAALWAYSKGLVSGNKLNPNAACTRAMTVTYLWKLAGSPAVAQNDINYTAYTISDHRDNEYSWSVSFEAAQVEERVVTDMSGEYREWTVTVVSVKPGTKITVQSNGGDIEDSVQVYLGNDEPDYYVRKEEEIMGGYGDAPYDLQSGVISLMKNQYYDCWTGDYLEGTNYTYHIVLGDSAAKSSSFTDVPATADYAQAVAWAVENGITSGTSGTAFSPAQTCTRGQIVTFLYRAMGR